MAGRDRRNLAITFVAAIVLVLAAAVIAGQVLGGQIGRRTVAMMANIPAAARTLAPPRGPANPSPPPSPLPHRPG